MNLRIAVVLVLLIVCHGAPAAEEPQSGENATALQRDEIMKSLLLLHYATDNPVISPLTHLIFGDVNGDERKDAILTYQRTSVVGTDVELIQRVVVFIYDYDERDWKIQYDAKIGSSKSRILIPKAVEGGVVSFVAVSCSPTESSACQEGVTESQFQWTSEGLVEM